MWLKIRNNYINTNKIENVIIYDDCILVFLEKTTYHYSVNKNLTQAEFNQLKSEIENMYQANRTKELPKGLTF